MSDVNIAENNSEMREASPAINCNETDSDGLHRRIQSKSDANRHK